MRPDDRVAYHVYPGWADRREFPRWSSAPLMSAPAGVAAAGEPDGPTAAASGEASR